ncbi:MAG: hypothetical protein EI684_14235 [Candidatus Viridilinea halotolerans]|uniref:Uncharacterized protein n=1 Tax=Candidatus Viridilinea halotolerans TaxID=2491704 RepID=A0A426TWM1_9CHLR|nr:MAG: hypothetical protein EI684_14235 [Candidatus Viridilinea halotolerans]
MPATILLIGYFPFIFTVIAIVIEGVIFFQMKWAGLKGAMRDAVIANLAALVVVALLSQLILGFGHVFASLLAALIVSIIVEGFVLFMLRQRSLKASYRVALIGNAAAFLFAYMYVASFAIL